MALPLDVLTRPITRDEAKTKIYSMLALTGINTTAWQEGAVTRTIIAILAALLAGLTSVLALLVRGLFLDLAEGIWLTLLALYVYNVVRRVATFASGSVLLTNNGGGVFNNVQPGGLIVQNPTTKKTYTNTAIFSLAAGPGTTATVPVRAIEAGSASTSSAGAITAFVTTFLGVTCSNAAPLVGLDEQTDPSLRQACRDSLGAASPAGPPSAYDYFAKRAPRADGTIIDVTRTKVVPSNVNLVTVIVANASGTTISAPDLTDIQTWLAKNALPTGQTLVVQSATGVSISFVGTLWVAATTAKSDAEFRAQADARLQAYLAAVPIGGLQKVSGTGKVFVDALEGQLFQEFTDLVDVDLSSPTGDTTLTSTQVPTFAGGGMSWTITRVVQA